MNESEFFYELPEPGVGLSGGWLHSYCADDDSEVTEEVRSWRHEGEGASREVVTSLVLTCSCGATEEVTTRDWDPDIPEE